MPLEANGHHLGTCGTSNDPNVLRLVHQRLSRNFKACVLTTTADVTHTSPLWATVQEAARNRPINAQHVVAPAGPTDGLIPYLNSLVALQCQLIITGGSDVAGALPTVAKANANLIFVNVSPAGTNLSNVHDLPNGGAVDIGRIITWACRC